MNISEPKRYKLFGKEKFISISMILYVLGVE